MTKPEPDLSELFAATMMGPQFHLGSVASQHPKLIKAIDGFDPVRLSAAFGALLTAPELQSNCLRLEALVHLALIFGNGKRKPTARFLSRCFKTLGQGYLGRMEDPAEDVFVTNIATKRGNFRVLEGTWESAGFYLQRFINVMERMPLGSGYDDIRESVYSLLALSDHACGKAGLVRWQTGNEHCISVSIDLLVRETA